MVRGDLVNFEVGSSSFEKLVHKIGGTWWPNAFTPGPDTPRSTASIFSGCYPATHGVNLRAKSCKTSFDCTHPSLLKSLTDAAVDVAVFRPEKEIQEGIWLPEDCLVSTEQFSDVADLNIWAEDKESFLVYWHESAYHASADLSQFISDPHEVGLEATRVSLESALKVAEFDYVWIVSDHGCKFPGESLEAEAMINRNRTNVCFFLHDRESLRGVVRDESLRGIFDLYPSILRQFGVGHSRPGLAGLDVAFPGGHEVIGIEDWSTLLPADRELPDLFGLRFRDSLVCLHNNRAVRYFDSGEDAELADDEFYVLARKFSVKFAFLEDVSQVVRNRKQIEAARSSTFPLNISEPLRTIYSDLEKPFSILKIFRKLRLVWRVPADQLAVVLRALF